MNLHQSQLATWSPVTLADAKQHSRIDIDDDDALITAQLAAAVVRGEQVTNRQFAPATWTLKLDAFPGTDTIELPKPPLLSVSSIQYVDTDGATQTFSGSDYSIDRTSEPGRVVLGFGNSWPSARAQPDAITITYVAGYGSVVTAVNATNVFTITAGGRTYADNMQVRLFSVGGDVPTGLTADTAYFIRDVSGSTFKLALTAGGTAISISSDGTGTIYIDEVPEIIKAAIKLEAAQLYENRESYLADVQGATPVINPTSDDIYRQQHVHTTAWGY
jgi:uncharacterized phiE125 gp8 family phage protein